jgi:hypothetical protein
VKSQRWLVAILASIFALSVFSIPAVIAWGGPCTSQTSITSNFNGTSIAAGDYIWFNSVMKLSGPAPSGGTQIYFTHQTITFEAGGVTYTLHPPDSEVIYSTSATKATFVYSGGFITTVPASFGDNVFLSGLAFEVPVTFSGGINPVTWSGTISGSVAQSIHWQWGAAVYTHFTTNYNALGIKPTHSTNLDSYPNGDQAGTPENFKAYVTGGARGGGGSNFTGSYSGTGSASDTCPTPASSAVPSGNSKQVEGIPSLAVIVSNLGRM